MNSGDAGAGRITEEPRSLGGQRTWNPQHKVEIWSLIGTLDFIHWFISITFVLLLSDIIWLNFGIVDVMLPKFSLLEFFTEFKQTPTDAGRDSNG